MPKRPEPNHHENVSDDQGGTGPQHDSAPGSQLDYTREPAPAMYRVDLDKASALFLQGNVACLPVEGYSASIGQGWGGLPPHFVIAGSP